jgi:opacity protein-like surface antigen
VASSSSRKLNPCCPRAAGSCCLREQGVQGACRPKPNATLSLLYRVPATAGSRFRPYFLGGGGVYNFDLKGDDVGNLDSSTKFGLEGGIGADFEISPRFAIFVEGRYHNVFTEDENFQVLPVTVGGRIGIGAR